MVRQEKDEEGGSRKKGVKVLMVLIVLCNRGEEG